VLNLIISEGFHKKSHKRHYLHGYRLEKIHKQTDIKQQVTDYDLVIDGLMK